MIVPAGGSRIMCTTCGGDGKVSAAKRAQLSKHPGISTIFVDSPCRPCEGTGWIPPLRPDAEIEDPDSGDEG